METKKFHSQSQNKGKEPAQVLNKEDNIFDLSAKELQLFNNLNELPNLNKNIESFKKNDEHIKEFFKNKAIGQFTSIEEQEKLEKAREIKRKKEAENGKLRSVFKEVIDIYSFGNLKDKLFDEEEAEARRQLEKKANKEFRQIEVVGDVFGNALIPFYGA